MVIQTLPTCSEGKCLILDFAVHFVNHTSKNLQNKLALQLKKGKKKVEKYLTLSENYHFIPVGAETYGAFGPQGLKLLKKIGAKIREATGENRSTLFYLLQSISMAIQHGNAACVIGTAPTSSGLEGIFEFFTHETDHD